MDLRIRLWHIVAFAVAALAGAVYLVLRPAPFPGFIIGDGSAIGSLIGGLSTLIVGLTSVILLYLTLQRQINKDLRQDLEAHYSRIEQTISTFSFKKYVETPATTGVPAIQEVANDLGESSWLSKLKVSDDLIDGLWLLLTELDAFLTRVGQSQLAEPEKLLLSRRIALLYTTSLSGPFRQLARSGRVGSKYPRFNKYYNRLDQHVKHILSSTHEANADEAKASEEGDA